MPPRRSGGRPDYPETSVRNAHRKPADCAVVVDVREPYEYAEAHVPRALVGIAAFLLIRNAGFLFG